MRGVGCCTRSNTWGASSSWAGLFSRCEGYRISEPLLIPPSKCRTPARVWS